MAFKAVPQPAAIRQARKQTGGGDVWVLRFDTTRVVMHRVVMKTITLTDEAYERLKAWKVGAADSFSKVVLRSVPKRGTAGDMNDAFALLPVLSEKQAGAVEESLVWSNDWRNYSPDETPVRRDPKG